MAKQDDERFAHLLVALAHSDVQRLSDANGRRIDPSTAAWMAEELRRYAESLRLSPETAGLLRRTVEEFRRAASTARRAQRGAAPNGANPHAPRASE